MELITDTFPEDLFEKAKLVDANYLGYIPPGEKRLLFESGDTPTYEAKIDNNILKLEVGEAGQTGKFALCVAIIGRKGNNLYLMHSYPRKNILGDINNSSFTNKLLREGVVSDDSLFDEMLFIGKDPGPNAEELEHYSKTKPVSIPVVLDETDNFWNIILYNDPKKPGDIRNYRIWTSS